MNEEQIEAYIESASAALGLTIAPEHMPGVVENFARLAAIAARCTELAGQLIPFGLELQGHFAFLAALASLHRPGPGAIRLGGLGKGLGCKGKADSGACG